MCGIFGKISKTPLASTEEFVEARDTMLHRGPDAGGIWFSADRLAMLAHRRLSIIDLSENANQPMFSQDGRYVIVFNGEIYNFSEIRIELIGLSYEFKTESDTEVILQAFRHWGPRCVEKMTGMFAFAIFDQQTRKLFLARDRAGEKPLFYVHDRSGFVFASELKAIMAQKDFCPRIDNESFDCFLSFGYVPGERCVIAGAKKLPPAHTLLFDMISEQLEIRRYWVPPAFLEKNAEPEELVDEFEDLLQKSVKRQLVSDVPLGVLLSGGLDSSLVTAMAVRGGSRVKTFTVRFPGYKRFDETEHARIVARHFATDHLELDAVDTSPDLISRLACQFDEPMVDSSMIPTYLVSRLVKQHCTVALGGDGGDELFGGYAHYAHFLKMNEMLGWCPRPLRRLLACSAETLLPLGFKGRNWYRMAGIDFNRSVPVVGSLFESCHRQKMLSTKLNGFPGAAESIWQQRTPDSASLLDRYCRMDFHNYLPEDILVKVDRAGMLNSVEMRAPFLDHQLIEFAFAKVPPDLKVFDGKKKIFLKMAAERLLPAELNLNRKQGFSVPLHDWLKKPDWRSLVCDTLLATDSCFDHSFVKKLLKLNFAVIDNAERLFALTMFELWRKNYRVNLG